jgi:Ser/Thr protein kinase RdoA (MazF antagonist)
MSDLGEDRRGAVIGRGRTAEVYKWGDEQALKLFHDDLPEARVRQESRVAAVLSALAVPAPRFDGAIEIAGRRGLLFERVAGPTMLALLVRRPWLVAQLAQQFADLHLRIHHQVGSDLPPQRAYLAGLIAAAPDVPSDVRQGALKRLSSLPEGTGVCHGDFHPDNVLMAGHGPVVIDWMAAVRGEPAADVARTLLLLEQASLPPGTSPIVATLVQAFRRFFARRYWRQYSGRSSLAQAQLALWRLPLLVARLGEGPTPDERQRFLRLLSADGFR